MKTFTTLSLLTALFSSAYAIGCGDIDGGLPAAAIDEASQPIVYYLGSEQGAATLATEFDVRLVDQDSLAELGSSSGNILMVDGRADIDEELLTEVAQAENTIIALQETKAIEDLFADDENGVYTDSGTVIVDESQATGAADGDAAGVETIETKTTAYGIYRSVEHVFSDVDEPDPDPFEAAFTTAEPNPVDAALLAYNWAVRTMEKHSQSEEEEIEQPLAKGGASWKRKGTRSYEKTTDGGSMTMRNQYSKLVKDGDKKYDWWAIKFVITASPNTGDNWRLDDIWNTIEADHSDAAYQIFEHAPTSSTSSASVSLGAGAGGVTIGWSYSLPSVTVNDRSNVASEVARWYHDVDLNSNTAQNSYAVNPGVTLRVPQGTKLKTLKRKVYEYVQVRFAKKIGLIRWQQQYVPVVFSPFTKSKSLEVSKGLCMAVAGNSTSDEANIHQAQCLGTMSQSFRLKPVHRLIYDPNLDLTYEVKPRHSNKCLDIHSGSTADGANVKQLYCKGGHSAQWFTVESQNRTAISLKNVRSNKCLDVAGSQPGANVRQMTCNGSNSQTFKHKKGKN